MYRLCGKARENAGVVDSGLGRGVVVRVLICSCS